ncbi:MAG TPA: hypothetical protein VGE74_28545 [Gemmata sp.]
MTDDEFLTAFEACALRREDWTHEAHVHMAWLYATRNATRAECFDRVRAGIMALNAVFVRRQSALGVGQSKPKDPRGLDGYHETVTGAFVAVIAARVRPGEDFPTFRDRNPDLFDRTLTALLRHYSPEQLFSEEAKKEFVPPDLEPLPQ